MYMYWHPKTLEDWQIVFAVVVFVAVWVACDYYYYRERYQYMAARLSKFIKRYF